MNGVCATATAHLVRLVLQYVTLRNRPRDLSRKLHNALWHHLTQRQLDPSASYKRKLVQYSLYGHHGRGDEETEENVVRGSEEEKETVTEQEVEQESVSDWLLLVGERQTRQRDASQILSWPFFCLTS